MQAFLNICKSTNVIHHHRVLLLAGLLGFVEVELVAPLGVLVRKDHTWGGRKRGLEWVGRARWWETHLHWDRGFPQHTHTESLRKGLQTVISCPLPKSNAEPVSALHLPPRARQAHSSTQKTTNLLKGMSQSNNIPNYRPGLIPNPQGCSKNPSAMGSVCLPSHSVDSLWPHGLEPTGLLSIFPGKNAGVSCHFHLQGIFPTQGLNLRPLHLLHCRRILYHWATEEAHGLNSDV